jgi:hypothetical protein
MIRSTIISNEWIHNIRSIDNGKSSNYTIPYTPADMILPRVAFIFGLSIRQTAAGCKPQSDPVYGCATSANLVIEYPNDIGVMEV